MVEIDRSKPVMVTGATGYVAGRLIELLLEEGMTVHAPVRDLKNKEKLKYLDKLEKENPGKIIYFKADLLKERSYDDAMNGCELVFHTASPFKTNVKDPQKELIEPALSGTRNVLESVNRTSSVKKVVLTSSVAAILGDNKDLQEIPGGIADESNWNFSSSLEHQPYSYSKTVAEKEAWKIAESQNRWRLVVINPAFVIGPGINPKSTSDSFNLIKQLGDGSMRSGVPDFELTFTDVRDVAEAHFKVGFKPNVQGRYIIGNERKTFLQTAQILRKEFGDKYPFPKRQIPKFLVWLMGPLAGNGITRKFVSRNIGYPWKVDNSKSIKELEINYIPFENSIIEFFEQMIDAGVFDKK